MAAFRIHSFRQLLIAHFFIAFPWSLLHGRDARLRQWQLQDQQKTQTQNCKQLWMPWSKLIIMFVVIVAHDVLSGHGRRQEGSKYVPSSVPRMSAHHTLGYRCRCHIGFKKSVEVILAGEFYAISVSLEDIFLVIPIAIALSWICIVFFLVNSFYHPCSLIMSLLDENFTP